MPKPAPLRFDLDEPICDGIHFDEATTIRKRDPETARLLSARGLVWGTTFRSDAGTPFGGSVIAGTLDEAKKIADARGLGETIDGQIVDAFDADDETILRFKRRD